MKVILLKDVAKVGRRHEIKELADGYARNFIIARGLGVPATGENLAKLKNLQAQGNAEKNIQNTLLKKLLAEVGGKPVVISSRASEQGHLFASVRAEDIVKALESEYRISLPVEAVDLPEPIKSVGDHFVQLKTASPEQGRLLVRVIASK